MAAQKGNKTWELRSSSGRKKLFETPELLWNASCEYFQWVEENPLIETKSFCYQGSIINDKVPVMRAMTLSQLCFYLNCNEAYFRNFKSQLKKTDKYYDDFNTVIHDIERIIYNQKFQGASANMLNANIIARDLGLKDSSEVDTKHSMSEETLEFLKKLNDKIK